MNDKFWGPREDIRAVFGNELDLRKWIDIVIDLIDMRKKSKNVLYKKNEIFCFVVIFLFE